MNGINHQVTNCETGYQVLFTFVFILIQQSTLRWCVELL